jgi:hypothetical protein
MSLLRSLSSGPARAAAGRRFPAPRAIPYRAAACTPPLRPQLPARHSEQTRPRRAFAEKRWVACLPGTLTVKNTRQQRDSYTDTPVP